MIDRLRPGLVISMIIVALFIAFEVITLSPSTCFQKPEISDIQIQPIDKNSIEITWRTDTETYGVVEINEQDRVYEILENSFSCNFTGNLKDATKLPAQSEKPEKVESDLKKYNCSLFNENGEVYLMHKDNLYGYSITWNSRDKSGYLGGIVKPSSEQNSTYHSVVLDVLDPDTKYTFEIHADNACEITSIKSVEFGMP